MEPTDIFALGVLVAGALSGPPIFWLWRKSREHEDNTRKARQQLTRLQEVMAGMPDGLYRWNLANGVENCSPRLAVLLGLPQGSKSRFEDLLAAFEEEAASALGSAVSKLHRDGAAFDMVLPLKADERLVQAIGTRVLAEDGAPLVDLMWMRLASEAAVESGPMVRALRETSAERDQLMALLNGLPFPAWLRDKNLNVIFANTASPDQVPGEALAARALANGTPFEDHVSLTCFGREAMFRVMERPLPGSNGTIGIAQDMSANQQAQKSADTQAAFLEAALNSLPAALAIFQPDGRLALCNESFSRMWQLPPEWLSHGPSYGEILDRLRDARLLPEHANFRAFREDQTGMFGKTTISDTMLWHLPDNRSLRVARRSLADGGMLFAYENVTDNLALESSNKTLVAIQRQTLDHLYEGVAVFGGDGRLKLHNPAFADIWHLDTSRLEDAPHLADILDAGRELFGQMADWEAFRDGMVARCLHRETMTERLHRADGVVLQCASVPLPDGGTLLLFLDVSQETTPLETVASERTAMAAALASQKAFLALASHAIRTPANNVAGFSQILASETFGSLNPRQQDYVADIQNSIDDLVTTVAHILETIDLDTGVSPLSLAPVNPSEMMSELSRSCAESARAKQVSLDIDAPAERELFLMDGGRIRQAMLHLLTCVLSYAPRGGDVTLSCRVEGDWLVLSCGVSAGVLPGHDLERTFGSYIESPDEVAALPGPGLGLALARSIAEQHGGTLFIHYARNGKDQLVCKIPARAGGDYMANGLTRMKANG